MRALVNRKAGGPEVLVVEERPDLTPKAGEVRIRVKRAGLNFADISARVGLYPDAPKFPMVMGYEVGGVVDGVGAGVTTVKDGDRVTSLCRFGGQATMICVPATQVAKIPDAMSFDEAAALPVNYLTAYQMLFWTAPVLAKLESEGDAFTLRVGDSHAAWRSHQDESTMASFETLFATLSERPGDWFEVRGLE